MLNKIDVISSDTQSVAESVESELGFPEESISKVSAKTGQNVESLIQRIINEVPAPQSSGSPKLKLFLINSWFIKSKGVACLLLVKSGELKKGTTITSCASGKNYQVFEVGILNPELK